MPVPQQFATGDKMGRGPYEKSGLVEDTSLPPGKKVEERFELYFLAKDVQDGGKNVRKVLEDEYDISVKLWYLPYGDLQSDPFLWREENRKVQVSSW
jgi:hypothetical protein